MKSRHPLGGLLLRNGAICEAQLGVALSYQKQHSVRLGEALLTLGYCREADIARALAEQMGMPFVDLEETPPARELLREIPSSLARKLGVVPADKKAGTLVFVARNPNDYTIDAQLRQALGMPVTIVCGVETQIQRILEQWERILIGAHTPPEVNHLPLLSSRLGARAEVLDVKRFQEGATSPARVGAIVSDYFERGQGPLELIFNHNTLRVMALSDGSASCLAELPGDHFRFTITPPARGGAVVNPAGRGAAQSSVPAA
jgi:hypothetical protein